MPYKLDGNCVVKADTGKTVKCHKTHAEALAHLRALEANVSDAADKQKMMLLEQKEVNYGAASGQTGKACSNCRWFDTWGESPRCNLVVCWPEPIEPNGLCDRHEVIPPPEPLPIEVVIVEPPVEADDSQEMGMAQRKSFWERTFNLLFGSKEQAFHGFKVLSNNRWVGWWTNNFEDREGEIFTEKAIDDFIASVKSGLVEYPELWFWHIEGTKHGKADGLWRLGHFALATGTFDSTPMAQQFKAYYQTVDHYGMSHGYEYFRSQKSGRFYNQFKTRELSPLRNQAAANDLTYWEVKQMQISAQAQKELEAALGAEQAKAIIAAAEARNKEAEATGRDYKGFTPDQEFETLKEQVKGLVTAVKGLSDLNTSLTAVAGLPAQLKTIQDGMNTIMTRQTELEKKAAEWTDLQPPASQSTETLLGDRDKADLKKVQDKAAEMGKKSLVEQAIEGVSAVGEG